MKKRTVIVGMSGGVDSSVSALLLQQQGYHVIGLFMKNWEEEDEKGVCKASLEYADVVRVCDQLHIPYYSVNFVEEYKERVFASFLANLRKGLTPNPDILCNREIKFQVFLEKAEQLGADFFATGHYCRTVEKQLLKGNDPEKDQSYFLSAIQGSSLQRVLFPVGHLYKKEVRALAQQQQLATWQKKDSTGICFIGKRDFSTFISQYLGYCPGDFQLLSGKVVGRHSGIAYYTIGQRKGLGLGGEGEAWYVVDKDLERNIVFVERGADHPALFKSTLQASSFTWITQAPSVYPFSCSAKIRYRQVDQECIVHAPENGIASVTFAIAQRAVTPGQTIAFYQGDVCLGSAIIG